MSRGAGGASINSPRRGSDASHPSSRHGGNSPERCTRSWKPNMTRVSLESYLRELSDELQDRGIPQSRIIDEAQAHLSDAIALALQEGLTQEAAEQRTLERFGSASGIAGQFAANRRHSTGWILVVPALAAGCAWSLLPHGWESLHVLGTQNLLVFISSGILLNLTPGQDTLYILARSVAQGRRAGVLS